MKYLALFIAIYFLAAPASAHQAPSGWVYDSDCCSEKDCRPAEDGEISLMPDGYHIAKTNEVIPYGDKRVRPSGDGHMHICQFQAYMSRVGPKKTTCIYIPPDT